MADLSNLIEISKAWSNLGEAVQSQVEDLLDGPHGDDDERYYGINANAVDMIERDFYTALVSWEPDAADELLNAIEAWRDR